MTHDTPLRSITLVIALLTAASLTGPVAAGAQQEPGSDRNQRHRAEPSTGLFTLDFDTTVRLTVVDVSAAPGRHPVQLKVFDAFNRVLAHKKGMVEPGKPLTLELSRGNVRRDGPLRVRAVAIFPFTDDDCTGIHFSIELEDEIDGQTRSGGDCGCPCCGPPLPQGATGDCTDGAVI